MPNVYRPSIPADAKRGATLLAYVNPAHLVKETDGLLDKIDNVIDKEYAYNQAMKVRHLDTLSNLTEIIAKKAGSLFSVSVILSAAASIGVTGHEIRSLVSNGALSGDFSTPTLALASVITGGLTALIATELVSEIVRDLLIRNPDIDDAYNRLIAGADKTMGRVFQDMLPVEREKASELVGLFSQVHAGNTPLLQSEIRTLIDQLKATESKNYGAELDHQIEMVRSQLGQGQELAVQAFSPKTQARSQMER